MMQAADVQDTVSTYCPSCDREVVASVVERPASIAVRGEAVDYLERVAVCPVCGGEIGDSNVESGNIKRAYDVYRESNGLMTPDEIRALRNSYGLSLREFAKFLGFGEQTVARYERGALQDKLHDSTMRWAATPEGAAALLASNGGSISEWSRERVERFIKNPEVADFPKYPLPVEPICVTETPKSSNGFRPTSMDRVKALIARLCQKCDGLYMTKLHKALFFADYAFYEQRGRSLTGLTYAHLPAGPVVNNHAYMMDDLEREGFLHLEKPGNGKGNIVVTDAAAPTAFTDEELSFIDSIAEFVNTFPTANSLSSYSHKLRCWDSLKDGEIMSYTSSNGEVSEAIRIRMSEFKKLDATN